MRRVEAANEACGIGFARLLGGISIALSSLVLVVRVALLETPRWDFEGEEDRGGDVPSDEELERDGYRILEDIRRYREVRGQYPVGLASAGILPRFHVYGGWQYESHDDGTFQLWCGDGEYGTYGVRLYWGPEGWTWDD